MKRRSIKAVAIIILLCIVIGLSMCRGAVEPDELLLEEIGQESYDVYPLPEQTEIPEPEPEEESGYIAVESIAIMLDVYEIAEGTYIVPEVIITPEDAADKYFTLLSSDDEVLSYSEGQWIAVGAGTAELVAVARNGVMSAVTIIVYAVEVEEEEAEEEEVSDEAAVIATENGFAGGLELSEAELAAFVEEVFRLVNIERESVELSELAQYQPLTLTAQVRANEITEHFSHTRPDGTDCFTAFSENGVVYQAAGENLAAGHRTPYDVMRGWMNSPTHRDNIVNPDFGRMGVAIAVNEEGRLYWAQAFID
ncbi:MAG: CAP domain-containing protein [Oscillospiraceae bacterium]|nr:CAP domain-containing protein [Oscillospiraceae bacterium]